MFNIGTPELILIAMVALMAFGPGQLPDFMRTVARAWRQFRQMTDGVRHELNTAIRDLDLDGEPRPRGYDATTHSVPYQEPDVPGRIPVGNNGVLLGSFEPLEPVIESGDQLDLETLWDAAPEPSSNGHAEPNVPAVDAEDAGGPA